MISNHNIDEEINSKKTPLTLPKQNKCTPLPINKQDSPLVYFSSSSIPRTTKNPSTKLKSMPISIIRNYIEDDTQTAGVSNSKCLIADKSITTLKESINNFRKKFSHTIQGSTDELRTTNTTNTETSIKVINRLVF